MNISQLWKCGLCDILSEDSSLAVGTAGVVGRKWRKILKCCISEQKQSKRACEGKRKIANADGGDGKEQGVSGKMVVRRMNWEILWRATSRSPPAGGRGPKGSHTRFSQKIQSIRKVSQWTWSSNNNQLSVTTFNSGGFKKQERWVENSPEQSKRLRLGISHPARCRGGW